MNVARRAQLGLAADLRTMGRQVLTSGTLQVVAFLLATVLAVGMLALLGYSPATVAVALWDGAVGSPGALSVSLGHAVPFMLTGLSVWVAYQAGLFNVGPDGQLQIAGLATVAALTSLPQGLPGPVLIVVGIAAGTIAGVMWALPAVALRLWRGANEIITTLMLLFIALDVVNAMLSGPMRSSTARFTPQTERIPDAARLPDVMGTSVTLAAVLAVTCTVAVVCFVEFSRRGLRLRAIGLNATGAEYVGIAVPRYRWAAFLASGAFAGLAGALVIVDLRFLVAPGWAPLWGFGGILIAFLVRRAPILIPVWGVLFGMLSAAGPALKGAASVPDSVVIVIQILPIVVLFALEAAGRLRKPLSPAGDAALAMKG